MVGAGCCYIYAHSLLNMVEISWFDFGELFSLNMDSLKIWNRGNLKRIA